MIYEFVGLPGSGKTQCAQDYASHKGAVLITRLTRRERLLGFGMFFLRHPLITTYLIRETLGQTYMQRGLLRHKLLFLCVNTLARETLAARNDQAVVDEGIVQYLYSLYEQPVPVANIERYVRTIKSLGPRMVQVLDVSYDVRQERMASRGRVPRSAFGVLYGEKWAAALELNHPTIRDCVRKNFQSF